MGYLHLQRYVLRPVRHPEAHASGSWRRCGRLLPPRLGRHHHLRPDVLPHRHHQKEDDDDLRCCCQVQELPGLRYADPQERGLHVHDEGSRRQRAERCGRSRCPRRVRQVQGRLHRLENGQVKSLYTKTTLKNPTPSKLFPPILSILSRSLCIPIVDERSPSGELVILRRVPFNPGTCSFTCLVKNLMI